MKVHYTGKLDKFAPKLQKKLDARFAKLGKMLDRRSEKEAHVILNTERHLNRAEITVHYYDHALIGVGADTDTFTALTTALDKLEKQLLKQREKWRDTKRGAGKGLKAKKTPELAPAAEPAAPKVYKVNEKGRRKPMSIEEAMLEMGDDRDYLIYRDEKTERVSVLMRRRDGHFDLVES